MRYNHSYKEDVECLKYVGIPLFIAIPAMLLFVLFSLVGCHSESHISRKALRDMAKAEQRYNNRSDVDTVGAHYCNTMHPIKIGKGVTVYKTDTLVTTDTTELVRVDLDTVRITKVVTRVVRIHDTLQRVDTFENTRTQQLQAGEIKGLQAKVSEIPKYKLQAQIERERANRRLWWILVLVGLIAVYFIIKAPKLKVFEWRR